MFISKRDYLSLVLFDAWSTAIWKPYQTDLYWKKDRWMVGRWSVERQLVSRWVDDWLAGGWLVDGKTVGDRLVGVRLLVGGQWFCNLPHSLYNHRFEPNSFVENPNFQTVIF